MKNRLETIRKRVLQANDIQGLFNHGQSILSFWDLKLRVVLAKFSQIEIEEMANEV
jgi:hypothetical protein